MKLREHIEDFVVEELATAEFGESGDFLIARLEKGGLGTLEALREVARKLGVSMKRISFGGLKDARSLSRQYFSIAPGDPQIDKLPVRLKASLWNYEAVGRSNKPYDRSSYVGNRFELLLRDLSDEECLGIAGRAETVKRDGFGNYYDSQRFGSLEGADRFVARLLIEGDYEGALKAAIASPRPDSNAGTDRIKAVVRDHWGRWKECKAALPPSREQSIVTYLCDHSAGFVHAFELLDRPLRLLYTGAYQGYLWNRVLSRLVTRLVGGKRVRIIKDLPGGAAVFEPLNDEERAFLKDLIVPQPTPKFLDEPMDSAVRAAYEEVMAEENLTPRSFRLKKVRSTYFQKGRRQAVVVPRNLELSQAIADDLNTGKKKIALKCELPRGAYVTMLVKALSLE
jgi:tRNA pseudouridine13 synthase